MTQKYGHLANQVDGAKEFCCEVCGVSPVTWTWGDLHGEAMCVRCGTPYQLLQYEKGEDGKEHGVDRLPKLNIKPEWVPVLQQYWQETQQFTGFATIIIPRDYPECVEGKRKFDAWLEEHPEVMPEAR
jgi:hypothetical protein